MAQSPLSGSPWVQKTRRAQKNDIPQLTESRFPVRELQEDYELIQVELRLR